MHSNTPVRATSRLIARLVMALVIIPFTAHADDFTLSLSDDSAKGQFRLNSAHEKLLFGAGYTVREGGRQILNLDGYAQGRTAIGNLPMTVGLGLRTSYFHDSGINGGGFAPGGYVSANIPDIPGLSANGELHFSPDILSFGDAESVRHFETSLSYRVIRNAEVLAGFRYVSVDLDEGRSDFRIEKDLIVGLRLFF